MAGIKTVETCFPHQFENLAIQSLIYNQVTYPNVQILHDYQANIVQQLNLFSCRL